MSDDTTSMEDQGMIVPDPLAQLRADCGYDDESDADFSVDALIDYKNALEEIVLNDSDCFYCDRPKGEWDTRCDARRDGLHWTAAERIGTLELELTSCRGHLVRANHLMLQAAAVIRPLTSDRRRDRREARRSVGRYLPLSLETEAAKISDTMTVHAGDQSLPVGPTFDRLEGRSEGAER